jgi:transglutaminase-like putative cysteine protease
MRLDIRYRMSFTYDEPIWESQNEIRVRPRQGPSQRLIAYRLTPAPAARVLSFVDYWGTAVDHVGVREPHQQFDLVAEAAVETSDPLPLDLDSESEIGADPRLAQEMTEYLAPSPHTRWDDDLVDLAQSAIAGTRTARDRIDAVVELVHGSLVYERGSTRIGIEITDLLSGGRGVCQDFAHLTIALLRSVGAPSRYVSGYLFASDESALDSTDDDSTIAVQTHAWVEVFVPGHGWHAIDPTNQRAVAARHVVIGHGRDYDDVAPVRGVFVGGATPRVEAGVEIRHMEPSLHPLGSETPRRLSSEQLAQHRERSRQQHQQQQQQQQQ